ncbi:hypothetical protein [Geitlerinema sp. PCC 9228]|uniref:hypothetical protein n=1 Tax=Geitlerinema sp. PCC 9228 TaxID=111611 RepID=UPI0008F9C012|nr:hypothetical protein [Geitlerinema sp. PCC 9228]
MNIALGTLLLVAIALLLAQPLLAAPIKRASEALGFHTRYQWPFMWLVAIALHYIQRIILAFCRGITSPIERYRRLQTPLQKSGFWFSIANTFFALLVFRPDLLIACVLQGSFAPLSGIEIAPHLIVGFIFGAIAACTAFYHTFFVDFLKGQHHYEHVLDTTLEEALKVELPEELKGDTAFEHYASTRKLALDGMASLGGVKSAFELFCFHLLSGTLPEKCPTQHRGAAFYFFLCAHSPEYDTDWYAYSSLFDANRNPAGKSNLISMGAETSRAIAGWFWGRPDMVGEGLWGASKKVLIIIATLKPRLLKIWHSRAARVDFLRQIHQPPQKPDWLQYLEKQAWYGSFASYAGNLKATLTNDISLVIDRLYASVAIYAILFVMPAFLQDAWHEATHGAANHSFVGLVEAISFNLSHEPVALFTVGMAFFLPLGFVELAFLDNQDPPVEKPEFTHSIEEPVSWVPLYVLEDIAGDGNTEEQFKRLAAIIKDWPSVEQAAERLGMGTPLTKPAQLFKLVLGRFISEKGRDRSENPVRAYIEELDALIELQESKQDEGESLEEPVVVSN